jgi:hypothetical protein
LHWRQRRLGLGVSHRSNGINLVQRDPPSPNGRCGDSFRQKSCHFQIIVEAKVNDEVIETVLKYWAKED